MRDGFGWSVKTGQPFYSPVASSDVYMPRLAGIFGCCVSSRVY